MPLSRNLGTLNSWNLLGRSRPLTGPFYLYTVFCWPIILRLLLCITETTLSSRAASWPALVHFTDSLSQFSDKKLDKIANKASVTQYRGAVKFLAQPGRKQARKHVRNARDFNNNETRAVIKFLFFWKARRRRKFMPF